MNSRNYQQNFVLLVAIVGRADWHDLKPDFAVADKFVLLFTNLTASTVAEVEVEEELIAGESTEVVELVEGEVAGEVVEVEEVVEVVAVDLVGILALLKFLLCFL